MDAVSVTETSVTNEVGR